LTKDLNENIAAEVTSRLDEIFLEEETHPVAQKVKPPVPTVQTMPEDAVLLDEPLSMADEAVMVSGSPSVVPGIGHPAGRPSQSESDPLADLNAIILSLDWEISDEIMGALSTEVKRLTVRFTEDRVLSVLLQMMGAIGRYVGRNLAKSHPDSLRLLQSLFDNLRHIQHTSRMTSEEKKRILAIEVQSLKTLKGKIAKGVKSGQENGAKPSPGAGIAPEFHQVAPQIPGIPNELLARIMAELKSYAKMEIKKLVAVEMGKHRSS